MSRSATVVSKDLRSRSIAILSVSVGKSARFLSKGTHAPHESRLQQNGMKVSSQISALGLLMWSMVRGLKGGMFNYFCCKYTVAPDPDY
eukprot:2250755-Amphidinium_carterae.1